jgi:hypothetical protein
LSLSGLELRPPASLHRFVRPFFEGARKDRLKPRTYGVRDMRTCATLAMRSGLTCLRGHTHRIAAANQDTLSIISFKTLRSAIQLGHDP